MLNDIRIGVKVVRIQNVPSIHCFLYVSKSIRETQLITDIMSKRPKNLI